jgi:hypothetical protein
MPTMWKLLTTIKRWGVAQSLTVGSPTGLGEGPAPAVESQAVTGL